MYSWSTIRSSARRRAAARSGSLNGLSPSGLAIRPASSAACAIVTSFSAIGTGPNGPGWRKKRSTAAFTPYDPCPKYTVLRYCSRISRLRVLGPSSRTREDHLAQLALEITLRSEDPVLHELLGDRRAALLDLTRRQVLDEGPRHRVEVDAFVVPERLVFHRDDRVLEELRHFLELSLFAIQRAEHGHHSAGRVVDGGALLQVPQLDPRVELLGVDEDPRAHEERDEEHSDHQPARDDGGEESGARGIDQPAPQGAVAAALPDDTGPRGAFPRARRATPGRARARTSPGRRRRWRRSGDR